MAETNGSSHPNPSLRSLFHCLDPISLILSQNSDSDKPGQLRLTTTESFVMERGPRYKAYAELRESRIRARNSIPTSTTRRQEPELIRALTPPRKQVKFQTITETKRRIPISSSVVAQSVPDFSSVLRKENRRPPPLATVMEMTPPSKSLSKAKSMSSSRGSKSATAAGEKRGPAAARKSYASIEELKGFSLTAANAINGVTRIGGVRRSVLSDRALL